MEFEDNNKLFVFDKKEVVLIFVFVLVITVTSFTLGVRVGKGLSLKSDGYTGQDVQKSVELKSVEEEQADLIVDSNQDVSIEESLSGEKPDETTKKLEQLANPDRLDTEFSDISNTNSNDEKPLEQKLPSDIDNSANETEISTSDLSPKDANQFQGKFTINLASKKTRPEAEEFAAPYMASDLEVVINKVDTTNKGTWYRIGIGVFETYNQAKVFLEKNPVFFKGKKYWITEIK